VDLASSNQASHSKWAQGDLATASDFHRASHSQTGKPVSSGSSPRETRRKPFSYFSEVKWKQLASIVFAEIAGVADTSMGASPIHPIFNYFAAAVRGLGPVTSRRR